MKKIYLLLIILICGCDREKAEVTETTKVSIEALNKCTELSKDSVDSYHLVQSGNSDYWIKAGNGNCKIDYRYDMTNLSWPVIFMIAIFFFIGFFVGVTTAD